MCFIYYSVENKHEGKMKISPIMLFKYNKYIQKPNNTYNFKYKTLQKDIISFGCIDEELPANLQLYKRINEEEYQKLLQGESVLSSGYVTSDERGWGAKNWHSGISSLKDENYFITFKPDTLKFHSKRDNEDGTRYGLDEEYSLDNISNIRKGYHAHGELIWAENFDEAKKEDIEHKKGEIQKCIGILKSDYTEKEKDKAIDELLSYGEEIPQISDLFEKYVDYTNENDVNNLVYLINKLNNERDLPKYRKCLESYVNGVPAKEYALDFLQFYGDESDLDKAMQLIDKKTINSPIKIGIILANLSEEKDYPKIINKYSTDKLQDLAILTNFIVNINQDGKYLKKIEEILSNCEKLRQNTEHLTQEEEFNLWTAIDNCMSYLVEYGDENTLSLVELHCQNNTETIYGYYDAADTEKKKKQRLNIKSRDVE